MNININNCDTLLASRYYKKINIYKSNFRIFILLYFYIHIYYNIIIKTRQKRYKDKKISYNNNN
jgi:hypothetical protein